MRSLKENCSRCDGKGRVHYICTKCWGSGDETEEPKGGALTVTECPLDLVEEVTVTPAKREKEARALLTRMVKYVREDRAVTPGKTRLARLTDQVDNYLKRTHDPFDILRCQANHPEIPESSWTPISAGLPTELVYQDTWLLLWASTGAPDNPLQPCRPWNARRVISDNAYRGRVFTHFRVIELPAGEEVEHR